MSSSLNLIKSELVYYDENGYIYSCCVLGEPSIERVEAGNKYFVKLTLQGVKKDSYYEEFTSKFSDIADHTFKQDILVYLRSRIGGFAFRERLCVYIST